MHLLLDTHVAVWAIQNSPKLTAQARELLVHTENKVFVSAASIWEISIKHALGRERPDGLDFSGGDAIGYFTASGMTLLPVTANHAAAVGDLPPVHSDPFDRLIVAQALYHPLRLVTHDKRVAAYSNGFLLV